MEIQEMPPHIMRLSKAIKNNEEMERKRREVDKNTCKVCLPIVIYLRARLIGNKPLSSL
jgi:hypothetical protein